MYVTFKTAPRPSVCSPRQSGLTNQKQSESSACWTWGGTKCGWQGMSLLDTLCPFIPCFPSPSHFFFFFKLSLNSFSLSMSATINTHQPHYCYPGLENWVAPSQQPVFKSLPSSLKHECHKKLTRKSRSPHRNTWRWTRSREESNL